MKNRQIVPVSNKASEVIVPKPTKREVTEALVAAARKQHEDKEAAREAKLADLRKELADEIKSNVDLLDIAGIDGSEVTWWQHMGVEVKVKVRSTKRIKAIIAKIDDLPYSPFSEHTVRQNIQQALHADPRRVKALSESPEIKAMLATIVSLTGSR